MHSPLQVYNTAPFCYPIGYFSYFIDWVIVIHYCNRKMCNRIWFQYQQLYYFYDVM